MKHKVKSFLFFCFLLGCQVSFYAQVSNDSLDHYNRIIENANKGTELISAYTFFMNYKDEALSRNDKHTAIYGLLKIAIIEKELGDSYNSENSAVEALKLLEDLNINNDWSEENWVSIYNHLGIISKSQLNFENALKYYNEALAKIKKPINKAKVYGNIGKVFFEIGDYESSINESLRALEIISKTNHPILKARLLDNLGLAQSKLNKPEALNNLMQALSIRQSKEYQKGVISSYLHLFEHFKDRNKINKAESYASKALNIAKRSGIKDYRVSALSSVLELRRDSIINEFIGLKNSLEVADLSNKNKYANVKYNYEKKEKELLIAENELVIGKAREERLIIGLAFLIMMASFLYFLLKSKHKKEKLQQVYNTETRISKKVHDEVANDVYHVMTKLQSNTNINEDVLDDLEGIYTKTRDISKENSAINVEDNFDELLRDLLLSYKSNDVNVITRNISKIDWNAVQDIKKTTIYRVLQELMTNMKKHSKASVVVLAFNQVNKKLVIDYKDNGVGCEVRKHNGLQNTENRMQSINGTITFESQINNGFKAKIMV